MGLFISFDNDRDGFWTESALASACSSLGVQLSPSEVQSLFTIFDRDRDGRLSYADLQASLLDLPSNPSQREMMAATAALAAGAVRGRIAGAGRLPTAAAAGAQPSQTLAGRLTSGSATLVPMLPISQAHRVSDMINRLRTWVYRRYSNPRVAFLAFKDISEPTPVLRFGDFVAGLTAAGYSDVELVDLRSVWNAYATSAIDGEFLDRSEWEGFITGMQTTSGRGLSGAGLGQPGALMTTSTRPSTATSAEYPSMSTGRSSISGISGIGRKAGIRSSPAAGGIVPGLSLSRQDALSMSASASTTPASTTAPFQARLSPAHAIDAERTAASRRTSFADTISTYPASDRIAAGPYAGLPASASSGVYGGQEVQQSPASNTSSARSRLRHSRLALPPPPLQMQPEQRIEGQQPQQVQYDGLALRGLGLGPAWQLAQSQMVDDGVQTARTDDAGTQTNESQLQSQRSSALSSSWHSRSSRSRRRIHERPPWRPNAGTRAVYERITPPRLK